jgi:hypothetical protein
VPATAIQEAAASTLFPDPELTTASRSRESIHSNARHITEPLN